MAQENNEYDEYYESNSIETLEFYERSLQNQEFNEELDSGPEPPPPSAPINDTLYILALIGLVFAYKRLKICNVGKLIKTKKLHHETIS